MTYLEDEADVRTSVCACVSNLLSETYFILTLIQTLTYNLRRGCSVKNMVSVFIRSDNCNVMINSLFRTK